MAEKFNHIVLVVDDEEKIGNSIGRLIKGMGEEYVYLDSGEKALEIIKSAKKPFSLILSDQRMPGMDGSVFLEKAQKIAPETIRCLITGYDDFDVLVDAVNKGTLHRYITKPWDNNDLVEAVRSSLEQYEKIMEDQKFIALSKEENTKLATLNTDLKDKTFRYKQLLQVGQTITSEIDIKKLFPLIMEQTNALMETQRSTVFLHDKNTDELWSFVATGMGNCVIRIPSDTGVAGWVFKNEKEVIINDAYSDSRFNAQVDKTSGFKTETILCIPIFNAKKECIGVFQTLNSRDGEFTDQDCDFFMSIANYVSIALENAQLYHDVTKFSQDLEKEIYKNECLEKTKQILTKFVPECVVSLAEEDPEQLEKDKEPTETSVLFIDIQSFSSITENHDQRLVNEMIERHFSCYLECIHHNEGILNETSGDGLMVFFTTGPDKNHAVKAVSAGLQIIEENRRLNQEDDYPWGHIDLHMGINSGIAFIGATRMKSIAGDRWTYTASGLVTVLAARIGSFSKGTKLYTGIDTYELIKGKFNCEFVGTPKLKNISEPIPIFRVFAEKDEG